jgi:hypothetical protein
MLVAVEKSRGHMFLTIEHHLQVGGAAGIHTRGTVLVVVAFHQDLALSAELDAQQSRVPPAPHDGAVRQLQSDGEALPVVGEDLSVLEGSNEVDAETGVVIGLRASSDQGLVDGDTHHGVLLGRDVRTLGQHGASGNRDVLTSSREQCLLVGLVGLGLVDVGGRTSAVDRGHGPLLLVALAIVQLICIVFSTCLTVIAECTIPSASEPS